MGTALRLLLDTHVFYEWIYTDDQLPKRVFEAIRESEEVFVSLVSYWEFAIKVKIGKMQAEEVLAAGPARLFPDRFQLLSIEYQHIYGTLQLPLLHRDPFDRLLIAQANAEKLTLVSNDAIFARYDLQRFW